MVFRILLTFPVCWFFGFVLFFPLKNTFPIEEVVGFVVRGMYKIVFSLSMSDEQ